MILDIQRLQQLVASKGLVKNLSERELTNPEGAGFDLRLGEIFEISGSGFLGVEERKTPNEKSIASFEKNGQKKIALKGNAYYLVRTVEEVNIPDNLVGSLSQRTTLFRSGVALFLTPVHPGYKGMLTFGLANLRKEPFHIELGARIAHIQFFEVKGKGNAYRGQWQGGRVSARKKERQV